MASALKSQTSAFLFAFFLGNFGAHRFYLGNIGLGILYLFTMGLLGFGTLVDVISLAFMKADKFANKYNGGQLSDPIGTWAKVIVLIFPAVAIIGILAAIALPAYQDYTVRKQVSEPLLVMSSLKVEVAENYQAEGHCPDTSRPPAIAFASFAIDDECNIFATFDQDRSPSVLKGKSIGLYGELTSVAGELSWVCYSEDIPKKFLPSSCRDNVFTNNKPLSFSAAERANQEKQQAEEEQRQSLDAKQKQIEELAAQLSRIKTEQELTLAMVRDELEQKAGASGSALPVSNDGQPVSTINAYRSLPLAQSSAYINAMLAAVARNDEQGYLQASKEIELLRKPPRGDRQHARPLNDEGLLLLKQSKWDQALDIFTRAAESDPMDREIAGNLGFAYDKLGRLDEAKAANIASLTIEPTQATSWGGLGLALAKSGHQEEAVAAFRLAYRFSKYQDKTVEYFRGLANNDADSAVRESVAKSLQFMVSEGQQPY